MNEKTGGDAKIQTDLDTAASLLQQKENELHATGDRTALVRTGIELLEKADPAKLGGKCPLCHNQADGLLENLKAEWETELEKMAGHISNEIVALKQQQRQLNELRESLNTAKATYERVKRTLEASRAAISEFLGKELTAQDDPISLLKVDMRLIDERLNQVNQALRDRQNQLTAVE